MVRKDPFALTGDDFSLGLWSKKSTRKKCPPHLKPAIRQRWWRDKLIGECFCCGRPLHFDDSDAGHIKAASRGGDWSPENCRLICRTCNSGMRNTNMRTYMKRYHPERFQKYFPKERKSEKTKKTETKRRRNRKYYPFGLSSLGFRI
ncbi:MAG: HNH endonuclease [Candidatus Aenigmarchaeota archaeon]|nr:HNH endonuclease [Candidatus Aenigmarchaeota archaeon]